MTCQTRISAFYAFLVPPSSGHAPSSGIVMIIKGPVRLSCDQFSLQNKMSYSKAGQMTAYWLFVCDIVGEFNISTSYAHAIASVIWPAHSIQVRYKDEVIERKTRFRTSGPFTITRAHLLTYEVRSEVRFLL